MVKKLEVAYKTDVGVVRSLNEDSILIDEDKQIFLLADGMGGHNAGEEASALAVNTMWEELRSRKQEEIKATREALEKAENPPLLQILEQAVLTANKKIWQEAQEHSGKSGMGTTLIASMIQDNFAFFAFVGDSRAYLISDNTIQQISEDHSLVAQLVKNNAITQEEAKSHPYKNVIIRSLGSNLDIKPDLLCLGTRPDDIYLICSDGLSNMVPDDTILDIIMSNPLKEACEKLIDLANANGGNDNVSVILFKVVE